MYKYETTLEEAKKIKSLGFDFSLICEKFFYDPEDGNIWMFHKVYTMSGKEYLKKYDTRQVMRSLNFGAEDVIQDAENEIAIIPYPVLEACLPDTEEFYWGKWKYHNKWQYVLQSKHCEDDNWTFQGVCKAFLHSIENYPTETKEQFNKVMDRSTKK